MTNPNMWKLGETIFAAFMDVEKEMGRLDNNLTITRPKARKNVLNARRLKKAEEKLESEEYSSREFLRAVTYSFNVTNDKYFDEYSINILIQNICYTADSIQRCFGYCQPYITIYVTGIIIQTFGF